MRRLKNFLERLRGNRKGVSDSQENLALKLDTAKKGEGDEHKTVLPGTDVVLPTGWPRNNW